MNKQILKAKKRRADFERRKHIMHAELKIKPQLIMSVLDRTYKGFSIKLPKPRKIS